MTEVRLSHGGWAVGEQFHGRRCVPPRLLDLGERRHDEVRYGGPLPGLDGPCPRVAARPAVQAVSPARDCPFPA